MTKKQKKTLYRILVSAVLYAAVAAACSSSGVSVTVERYPGAKASPGLATACR